MSVPKLALNVEEAATATGLSTDTIKKAIRAGHLAAKRSSRLTVDSMRGDKGDPAGRYLITVGALTDWLDGLADA